MIPLFLGLTLVNLLMLGVATALGYVVGRDPARWSPYHQLSGVLAAMTCVAVHCVVFTYFVATAKWVQHAVAVKGLDPSLAAPTRSFKSQAFPAALIAMAVVFVTAVTGAATFSGYFRSAAVHHGLAVTSLVVNALVAVIECRAIARNGALIDGILARVAPAEEPSSPR
jgi:hypothetical protein